MRASHIEPVVAIPGTPAADVPLPTAAETGAPPLAGWHWRRLSSLNQMAAVIDAILPQLGRLGFSTKDCFAARLVLEEAICNAIKHGHQYAADKTAEVRWAVRGDQLHVEVQDEGPGFDTAQIPDATLPENLERTGGRGLLLIRHYAAWVRHNRQGNCIIFCLRPSEPLAITELALVSKPPVVEN